MARTAKSKRAARIGTGIAIGLLVFFVSFPFWSRFAAPLIPDSVQDSIGQSMIESTEKTAPLCTGQEGRAAIEGLAKKLAAASGSDETFKIYVANADILNAFAAPGGHIVVYRAIIDNSANPNEMAGVLAHEMGHVVKHHPAKGIVEAVGYGFFSLLVPGSSMDTAAIGQSLLTSAHSRSDELAADREGVTMLNDAGIDSHGLVEFFATLDKEGDKIPGALEYVSTHPTGEHRTEALTEIVADGEPALTDAEWEAVKAMCQSTGPAKPITVGG